MEKEDYFDKSTPELIWEVVQDILRQIAMATPRGIMRVTGMLFKLVALGVVTYVAQTELGLRQTSLRLLYIFGGLLWVLQPFSSMLVRKIERKINYYIVVK